MDLEGFQLESYDGTFTEQAIPKIEVSLPIEEHGGIEFPAVHQSPELKRPKLEVLSSGEMNVQSNDYDPDFEFLKGLLPQIKELNKKRKREYFHQMSSALFSFLKEQDDDDENASVIIQAPPTETTEVSST